MDTLYHCLALFGGIGVLVYCSDWLVDGAVWAARRLGVSPFAVGLTIVAYGTSLPEAVVSVTAGLDGASEFAIGNIVGSNIANIGLVLGITAFISPISVAPDSSLFRTEAPWLTSATVIAVCAGAFGVFHSSHQEPMVVVGMILLLFSVLYTREALTGHGPGHHVGDVVGDSVKLLRRTILRGGRNVQYDERISGEHRVEDLTTAVLGSLSPNEERDPDEGDEADEDGAESSDEADDDASWGKITLYLISGFVGLVAGAKLMVWGGTHIATTLGVSDRIIAVTIVAIGTSLPELAASVAAARKGHPELAVGNVVGSCLFNLTFVLGAASIAAPLTVEWDAMQVDFFVMLGLTIGMFVLLWSGRILTRFEAAILVIVYAGFLSWVGYQVITKTPADTVSSTSDVEVHQVLEVQSIGPRDVVVRGRTLT